MKQREAFLVQAVWKLRPGARVEITLMKQGMAGEGSLTGRGNNVPKGPEAKESKELGKVL